MRESRVWRAIAMAAAASLIISAPGVAQDEGWGWTDRAELSFVLTAGNSTANTFGAKNTLVGEGGRSKLTFEAGGLRTKTTVTTRQANGTPTSFTVNETSVSTTTAENFFGRGRYDYTFTEHNFWFAGTGWDRNTFAGIESRINFVTGVGRNWVDRDDFTFNTTIGATYTIQNNVAVGPSDKFGGIRLAYDLLRALTANTTFESKLIIDENLKDTDDLRADLLNALSVAMSERLALKTSLQLLFDNQPSFLDVPLFTGGSPTGTTVLAELDSIDSIFTVALVVTI